MPAIQGEGDYRYEITNDWAKVPPGMEWREVGSVAIDHQDNVYVFNRGPHPMVVFDRDGNFLRSCGEGLFPRAHGAHFAPDQTLYLTDAAAARSRARCRFCTANRAARHAMARAVTAVACKAIAADGLDARIAAVAGDSNPLPRADVITVGMILHDWNPERKKVLVRKADDALAENAVAQYADRVRRCLDYTGAEFRSW